MLHFLIAVVLVCVINLLIIIIINFIMSQTSIRYTFCFSKKGRDYFCGAPCVRRVGLVVGFSACVDLWMCSSVYMHVCACVLGDKSLMWMMDSPGVSMMSRRRPHRSRRKVGGPFHTAPASVLTSALQHSHLLLMKMHMQFD